MDRFHYGVSATFPAKDVADEFVAWLLEGHLRDVLDSGAGSGRVVRLDAGPTGPWRIRVLYTFASRAAFDRYEREHAERLRAEGREKFPAERGVAFERETGEIQG